MNRKPAPSLDWLAECRAAFASGTLVRGVLSRPAEPDSAVSKITLRPVALRGELQFQWAERRGPKELHQNLSAAASADRLEREFPGRFRQLNLQTTEADFEFAALPSGQTRGRRRKPSRPEPPATEHNVARRYLIPEGRPCPFLHAAGIMTPDGRVRAAMAHKFRQINRFLELVDDIYRDLPAEGVLRVVDYGCGKSYLTLAIHHLLTVVHGRDVEILGIDRSSEVVAASQAIADRLGLCGLTFQSSEIGDVAASGRVDLAVALHACDTATDAALARAVGWQARVILAAPCCQHEVAQSMSAPALDLIEAHGILKERFAALATDALRAAALEAAGYRTQVLEFIEHEHTAKNLLIRGVLREQPSSTAQAAWRERFVSFKRLLGLERVALESYPPWNVRDSG
ncbi:MAG: SAM-dependent methyltransferase [Planctomyces sp.]|nr:SAM-dependent methyltransferase [Planctomyces sp.]